MNRHSQILCLVLATLLAAGCPETDESFIFELLKPRIRSKCDPFSPSKGGGQLGPLTGLNQKIYDLRFTFLQRKPGNVNGDTQRTAYEVACWHVVGTTKKANLLIPEKVKEAEGRFTVVVEAFEGGILKYVGRAENIKVDPNGSGTIYMRPTSKANFSDDQTGQGFSCVDLQKQYRAFHSATLLPNGEVFLYGGMIGEKDGDTPNTSQRLAFATGSAEVYRPSELDFWNVTANGLPRRAFHNAVLLPSPPRGPYRILVIGGIEPKEQTADSPLLELSAADKPFIFNPHPEVKPGLALVVTYNPDNNMAEVKQLPSLPIGMFPAVTTAGTTLALASGAATWTASGANVGFTGPKLLHLLNLPDDGSDPVETSSPTMINTRIGAAMAQIGTDYVVVGGHMDGDLLNDGEFLPSGGPTLAKMTFNPPMPVIWHTLTGIGVSDKERFVDGTPPPAAIWAGGFTLDKNSATPQLRAADNDPRTQDEALHLLRVGAPPTATVVPTTDPGHYASTGYHDAIRLPNGGVLLTGGKRACAGDSAYCVSNQVVVYDYLQNQPQLRHGSWALQTPRLGHRMTRLLDNSILITGGLTLERKGQPPSEVKTPKLLNKAELFLPRTGDKSEDLPLNRPPATEQDQPSLEGEICPVRE